MMTYESRVVRGGAVPFPVFTGERVYMRGFTQASGLPEDLARWQPTVDAMLDGVDAPGEIYLMVDQGRVAAGTSHRRPGLHIDGYWHSLGHEGRPSPVHSGTPAYRGQPPARTPVPRPEGRHEPTHVSGSGRRWEDATFEAPEALLLAASVAAARAFVGTWRGPVHEMGDCVHVDVSSLVEEVLLAGFVYAGNVTMLHESLPVLAATERTLVRLSVPGWTP